MLIFDIEANGLLNTVTKIHCLVIKNTVTGEAYRYRGEQIRMGIELLSAATFDGTKIIAHNGLKYDMLVFNKLYPHIGFNYQNVLDSLVIARLVYPDIGSVDKMLRHKWGLPGKLFGSHSLKAWGYRLKEHKAEYEGGWEEWNQEMEDYCEQDVHVCHKLVDKLFSKEPTQLSLWIEHSVAQIIQRQENYGFLFNQQKAVDLYATLIKHKTDLEVKLFQTFKPFYLRDGLKNTTPKADNRRYNYSKDAPLCKVKLVDFNPGSRDHIAHRLKYVYKWMPTEFTDSGKPKVDETVLDGLPYPEAKLLSEYMMVAKRIGQLAEGDEAWLRHVQDDGRIHGGVNTNGTVTGRMAHSRPNLAQVPAGYSPYGHQCRELFHVPPGKKLVGADASALELCALAGFMAEFDGGAYIKTATEGRKEDGTDVHTMTKNAIDANSRDDAKTWFYAFIYGAGDWKLGTTILKPEDAKAYFLENKQEVLTMIENREKFIDALKAQGKKDLPKRLTKRDATYILRGKRSREAVAKNIPALGEVSKMVKTELKEHKCLFGLDGRKLSIRSDHAALNTKLQSAGALIMKLGLIILDTKLQELGYVPGVNYEFVINVHDEWQVECDEAIAELVGAHAVWAMGESGKQFEFPCPISGEYRIGNNWAETH